MTDTPALVLPQIVAGSVDESSQTFYSEVTVVNSSAFDCQIFLEQIGTESPESPRFVLFGGDPLPLMGMIPAKGVFRQRIDVPADFPGIIQGALAVRNSTPGCDGALSADARYLLRKGEQLLELFSTGNAPGILPGGCLLAPGRVGLNADDETFSQPGFAAVSPRPATGRICIDGQAGDDVVLGPRCSDFDGRHTTRLFSEIFPEISGFDGGLRICYASEEADPPPIFPLVLDLSTLRGDVQFGAVPGQVTGEECCPDENRACMVDGRLQIGLHILNSPSAPPLQARYEGSDGPNQARFSSGEGTSEAEHVVQLIDGCKVVDGYWVFLGSTTDVEYELRVTDTRSGAVRNLSGPNATMGLHILNSANPEFTICRDGGN